MPNGRANGHMLECRDLTKVYLSGDQETHALRGVSLTIDPGEYVAIMGPSGSGKSTLMHILGALDNPTSGEYYFEGQEISEFSDDELADMRRLRIGFVFQQFNLLPRATVIRNVVLPLVYSGVPREEREERAEAALRQSRSGRVPLDSSVQPAFGRADPARGHRSGSHQRPGAHPGGRAHRQPRHQDRGHHPRDLQPTERARAHRRADHARTGGGRARQADHPPPGRAHRQRPAERPAGSGRGDAAASAPARRRWRA